MLLASRTAHALTPGSGQRVQPDQSTKDVSLAVATGWLRLGIASLLLAGIFAVLVAVARSPGIQGIVGEHYFRISLVGHVTFSLNVWLLSFAALLWTLVPIGMGLSPHAWMSQGSLWTATLGAAAMAGAAVLGLGQPSLTDYVPVLEHPIFGFGLIAFLAGVGLCAAHFLLVLGGRRGPLPLHARALRIAAVACLTALGTFIVAWAAGWEMDWATLAWGPGHLLQVVNAAAMIAAWWLLWGAGRARRSQALLEAALPLFLLPAALVPLLYLLPDPPLRGMVSSLTWSGVAVPTVVALIVIGRGVFTASRFTVSTVSLVVSLLLYAAGILAAILGLEGDTRVTAHYHGTVGAVTVAFMGLAYRLTSALGFRLRLPGLAWIQPLLYGFGLMLLIAGLFWASSFAGQRKVFEAFAQHPGLVGPMGLFGLGAILAILGGALFVLGLGASLWARPQAPLPAAEPL